MSKALCELFVILKDALPWKAASEPQHMAAVIQRCTSAQAGDAAANVLRWLDAGFKSRDTGSRADQSFIHANPHDNGSAEGNVSRHQQVWQVLHLQMSSSSPVSLFRDDDGTDGTCQKAGSDLFFWRRYFRFTGGQSQSCAKSQQQCRTVGALYHV